MQSIYAFLYGTDHIDIYFIVTICFAHCVSNAVDFFSDFLHVDLYM